MIFLGFLVIALALLGYYFLVISVRDASFKLMVSGMLCWSLAALIGYPVLLWILERTQ